MRVIRCVDEAVGIIVRGFDSILLIEIDNLQLDDVLTIWIAIVAFVEIHINFEN